MSPRRVFFPSIFRCCLFVAVGLRDLVDCVTKSEALYSRRSHSAFYFDVMFCTQVSRCSRVCYNLLVSFMTCSMLFVWRKQWKPCQEIIKPFALVFLLEFAWNPNNCRKMFDMKNAAWNIWSFGCFVVMQFNFMLLLPSILEICPDALSHFCPFVRVKL